jgi:hypothetical protein
MLGSLLFVADCLLYLVSLIEIEDTAETDFESMCSLYPNVIIHTPLLTESTVADDEELSDDIHEKALLLMRYSERPVVG